MYSVEGIFGDRATAENAIRELLAAGVPQSSIVFLSGKEAGASVSRLPTTDTEADGMGKTIGAYVGAVTGMSAGLSLGSVAATLLVPGVGPVMAIGLGAAALLGVGGGVAGAAIGDSSEKALDQGVPKDDVFVFRDLLKQGRSLVIVNTDSGDLAEAAQAVFQKNGSEDIESARRNWAESQQNLRRAS